MLAQNCLLVTLASLKFPFPPSVKSHPSYFISHRKQSPSMDSLLSALNMKEYEEFINKRQSKAKKYPGTSDSGKRFLSFPLSDPCEPWPLAFSSFPGPIASEATQNPIHRHVPYFVFNWTCLQTCQNNRP